MLKPFKVELVIDELLARAAEKESEAQTMRDLRGDGASAEAAQRNAEWSRAMANTIMNDAGEALNRLLIAQTDHLRYSRFRQRGPQGRRRNAINRPRSEPSS